MGLSVAGVELWMGLVVLESTENPLTPCCGSAFDTPGMAKALRMPLGPEIQAGAGVCGLTNPTKPIQSPRVAPPTGAHPTNSALQVCALQKEVKKPVSCPYAR